MKAHQADHRGHGSRSASGEMHAGGHDHDAMVRDMRAPWLWTNATVILLGLWLISAPVTFGYTSAAMTWSDMASGVALVVFAGAAFVPKWDFYGRWGAALVGTWLQFAPLVFWAPTAAAYITDTLIGALVITLTILVPMMPGMAHHMAMMQPGPVVPPGWTYNPSSWHQRAPMIGLAFVGWLLSRYLAAFQLGYIDTVWDPFFGDGTRRVLTSEVSRMFPVSDAGLGALAYTLEMLMAWMGGPTRWRSMPWMVTFFFILVVPLGIVHVVLVILQPVAVGAWCTICMAAAAVMLAMIPFAVDEVVAMGQFLRERVHAGKPFWRTFWVGDTMPGGGPDDRSAAYGAPLRQQLPAASWGVSVPWTLAASIVVGLWVMVAPLVFGATGDAAQSQQVGGALAITVAAISTAEVIRAGRFLNVLVAAWLMAGAWLFSDLGQPAAWSTLASAVALVALTIPRGVVRERYATWDRFVR